MIRWSIQKKGWGEESLVRCSGGLAGDGGWTYEIANLVTPHNKPSSTTSFHPPLPFHHHYPSSTRFSLKRKASVTAFTQVASTVLLSVQSLHFKHNFGFEIPCKNFHLYPSTCTVLTRIRATRLKFPCSQRQRFTFGQENHASPSNSGNTAIKSFKNTKSCLEK
ncbi:hypothetical protein L873DRAFT_724892 [Choiromyces venosus 120613-1]|uniref:Uncharacterized protein n=1 Tax=Choiromyces venosus 120613-1 TaxID=1336337 RepID=A0A3N4JRP6_9PEZI|nr:hypothetical protein L873DRAFT_724892 [Choiromyces venosus 120613-1]